jgi:hypothetical protein
MTDSKEFDSIKKILIDEAGQMPLTFKMNGCKFRWDTFKMAYEMSYPKSFEKIKQTAEEIIDWVNNEQKINQP